MRRRAGFTLIEVLVAMVVFATVVGALVTQMAANLSALTRARVELRAAALAEERMREIEAEAAGGTLPEPGTRDGVFAEPDDGLAWELVVEPWSLPLPPELANQPAPSTVFAANDGRSEVTSSSVVRVELRVFGAETEEGTDPEESRDLVDPFVALLVAPPEQDELALVEETP